MQRKKNPNEKVRVKLHCEHDDSSLGIRQPTEPTFRRRIVKGVVKQTRLSMMTHSMRRTQRLQKCN